jgi:hypothetical protein
MRLGGDLVQKRVLTGLESVDLARAVLDASALRDVFHASRENKAYAGVCSTRLSGWRSSERGKAETQD